MLLGERSRDWLAQAEGDPLHARSDQERGFYGQAAFRSPPPGAAHLFRGCGALRDTLAAMTGDGPVLWSGED
jgi:hypothetical protein